MKITCDNCGDYPFPIPDLPSQFHGTFENQKDRINRITKCPECEKRDSLHIMKGQPSPSRNFVKIKQVRSICDVLSMEFRAHADMLRKDFVDPMPTPASDDDDLLTRTSNGDMPLMILHAGKVNPIDSFQEFMHFFFRNAKETYSPYEHEAHYLKWLMKSNVFFLGEERDVYDNTEAICTDAELQFNLPFDNCLFFLQNSETGTWNISHFYDLKSFFDEWTPPATEASSLRYDLIEQAIPLAGTEKMYGYREWRFGSDVFEAHRPGLEKLMDVSRYRFLLKEQWHVGEMHVEMDYEEGMSMRMKPFPIPLTTSTTQLGFLRKSMALVDSHFHVTSISHPANYIVKVAPKLTKRDKRIREKGKKADYTKRTHFIIVDHQAVTYLNPANRGTHASPRPHKRRSHYRRVAERCKNLRARGVKFIRVRDSIIGKERFEDSKNYYQVMMDIQPAVGSGK